MAKLLPIQHTFDAGEITPLMGARSDQTIYSRGLSVCKNMLPRSQGPVEGREGFGFLKTILGTSGRQFSFEESWGDAYIVVVSDDGNIYVSDDVNKCFNPELVVNNAFLYGLDNWIVNKNTGSVTVDNGILSLNADVDATVGWVEAYQLLDTTGNSGLVHNVVVEMPDNDSNTMELRIGTTKGAGDILTVSSGGTSIVNSFTPNQDQFWVSLWKDGGSTETKRISRITIRSAFAAPTFQSFAHPWTANLKYIHAKMPPGANDMYFTHPNFAPQVLHHTGGATWTFGAVTFTAQPTHWTGTSWPRTLSFFQGRSWWGGPGEIFNASQSAAYTDLTTGTTDSDGFQFAMAKRGEIMWLVGLRNLLLGTRTAEHIITSESGIITPTDIKVEQQSAYGSNHCQPVELGNKAVYVSGDGERVHDIGYQWTAEQWLSTDLSYASQHLTVDTEINELAWEHKPTKTLACLLANGSVIMCLYDPDKEVVGWSKHDTDGFINSLARIEISGRSYFLTLMNRGATDGSLNALVSVEVLGNGYNFDSAYEEYSAAKKNTIDSGEHLKNRSVTVKIDGAVHPDVQLDSNGDGTLNWSGHYISYGLSYKHYIKLLPRDFPYEGGSTTGLKKRWNKVWVRILSSVLPHINDDFPAGRSPQTLMDTPEPMTSKDVQVTLLEYEKGEIEIENSLPFPLSIVGIFGEMNVSKIR